ncbi:hypothetical protein KKH39_02645 [Patescibacteria group bacterium]|nr:hypothetical protein [Patescibacteria group bacterium]
MFGFILVILGVLFLFQEMGIISGDFWGYFWSVILIVVGFSLMNKNQNKDECWHWWCSSKKKDKKHKIVDEQ